MGAFLIYKVLLLPYKYGRLFVAAARASPRPTRKILYLLHIILFPAIYAHKADDCAHKSDNAPHTDGEIPAEIFCQHGDAVGGNCASDICTRIDNARSCRNVAVFCEKRRKH